MSRIEGGKEEHTSGPKTWVPNESREQQKPRMFDTVIFDNVAQEEGGRHNGRYVSGIWEHSKYILP